MNEDSPGILSAEDKKARSGDSTIYEVVRDPVLHCLKADLCDEFGERAKSAAK